MTLPAGVLMPEGRTDEDYPYTLERLPVESIGVDFSYQRALTLKRMERIAAGWESLRAEPIRVNRRSDGSLWVVDGQHRLEAARKVGVTSIACQVYRMATVEVEAFYFWAWNTDTQPPRPVELFKSAIRWKDPTALKILHIVEECGYSIEYESASRMVGAIGAVDALMRLYSGNDLPGHTGGPARLERVLRLLADTWPTEKGAASRLMLMTISLWLKRYAGRFNEGRFARVLGTCDPKLLCNQAMLSRDTALHGKHSPQNYLLLSLWGLYNKGLAKKSLLPHPFWGDKEVEEETDE